MTTLLIILDHSKSYTMNYLKYFILISIGFLTSCDYSTDKTIILTDDELHLGNIDFPVTGSEEAQPFFKNGTLLLHSFEYEDSRAEFLKAQELDPDFVMAYWGEAMTYNHSLWQRQDKESALDALNKLDELPDERVSKAVTEIEKDFMRAINILLGDGTKYDRDLAYSEYMQGMTEKYPDNHEVSAFYAISLLGSSRNGRNETLYDHSARIAQGIIAENPNHPGALHYLIHSYDDPDHAHLANTAADRYAKVAPDATHALHMPSHIYVALGSWDKVVTSNIASWNASVKRMEQKELGNDARSYHALNWLQYGLLQRGEYDQATELLKNMIQYTDENPSRSARVYLISMKGGHLVETDQWDSELADIQIDTEGLSIMGKSAYDYIDGLKAFHKKDQSLLNKIIDGINDKRTKAELLVGEAGFSMCGSGGYADRIPTQLDIDMIRVMELELLAYRSSLQGEKAQATDYFRSAAELDDRLSYSFGPPDIFKPAHEAFGDWMLQNQNHKEALSIYKKALERNPRRLRALKGMKIAAEKLSFESDLAKVMGEIETSLSEKKRDQIL